MISPERMRGKGMGFADRPGGASGCLAPRGPVVARPKEDSASITRRPLGISRDLKVDFRRQVSLSKRTLARSGEAAPGLWEPRDVLVL
jgi:hypothetical protein